MAAFFWLPTVKSQAFLLLILVSLPSLAQQTSNSEDSPYAPRTHAYTSRDNPYAPGGIYDPYRGTRPAATGSGRNSAADLDLDNDGGGTGLDLEGPASCTSGHLASDVSASRHPSQDNRLGLGNSTKSIGNLNRPSTDGYGTVSHCGRDRLTDNSKYSTRKPGLGMNDALSGNLPK